MRLRRIEAVRFGGLVDRSLGDLGEGLTIVHGPNEAGKSTFTALVRYILYGFPSGREKEPQYYSAAGKRQGRLVFADDTGSWAVDRTEGPHGGPVEVRTLEGAARPGLVEAVTAGVSQLAYKVVFGFGLDEMARIEALRGQDDDIIARLYAASVGLRVSPHDVRAALDDEADRLFTPRGRNREINKTVAEIREIRDRLRALEREADTYQEARDRLAEIGPALARAREDRDERRRRFTEASRAAERLAERLQRIETLEGELVELRRALLDAEQQRAAVAIVEDDAPTALLAALAEESAAFTEGRQTLRDAEVQVEHAARRMRDALARVAGDDDAVLALGADATVAESIEGARDDIQRLALEVEARERDAQRAREAAQRAEKGATAALRSAGVEPGPNADSIVEDRLAALDSVTAAGLHERARRLEPAPLVLLISGLVSLAAGLVLREYVTVAIGVLLAIAGAVFLVRPARGSLAPEAVSGDDLRALGLKSPPTAVEASRMRRAFEAARSALRERAEALRSLEAAETDVRLATDTLAARRTAWAAWVAERGLPEGSTPASAAEALAAARDAVQARAMLQEREAAATRVRARLDDYVERLVSAARDAVDVPDDPTDDDVPVIVGRVRSLLSERTERRERGSRIADEIAGLSSRIEVTETKLASASADATAVLTRWDMAEGGSLEALQALADRERQAAEEAERSYDELAEERARLDERLHEGAREARGGELRLRLAGAQELLAEQAERYVVARAAAMLVGAAQERYERERQPDVVKRAREVFSHMTGERYPGLTVPLGGGPIEVHDARAGSKGSDVLSRGTADQLYLALRLGLIEQLDGVGEGLPVLMDDVLVNFDPLRRRGAADAIAGLAEHRQIVLFTCHPETAELMAEVAPTSTRIDLDACEA
ncbi:MAG: AAA family ATPase [Anaerosomatales bacterium]|nr:AAA family ATPase [Anaerosomatales bacterium]